MHLELLYCPFGTDGNIVGPFDHDFALTSLEKALKIEPSGADNLEKMKKAAAQKKKDVFVRGVLSVTVISAEDLPVVDFMGKADPFVVLIMKKSEAKAKTRVRFQFPNLFDFVMIWVVIFTPLFNFSHSSSEYKKHKIFI